jgi:hypothetical protein
MLVPSSDCELVRENEFEIEDARVLALPRKNGGSMPDDEFGTDDDGDVGVFGCGSTRPLMLMGRLEGPNDIGEGGKVADGDGMGVSFGDAVFKTLIVCIAIRLSLLSGIGEGFGSGSGMGSPRTAAVIWLSVQSSS